MITQQAAMYTKIHTNKYIEHLNQAQQALGKEMYENSHIQTVSTDLSRRREQKPSTSRTFVRLNVLDYKRARQSRRESVLIQSALWQAAVAYLKIAVVKS